MTDRPADLGQQSELLSARLAVRVMRVRSVPGGLAGGRVPLWASACACAAAMFVCPSVKLTVEFVRVCVRLFGLVGGYVSPVKGQTRRIPP